MMKVESKLEEEPDSVSQSCWSEVSLKFDVSHTGPRSETTLEWSLGGFTDFSPSPQSTTLFVETSKDTAPGPEKLNELKGWWNDFEHMYEEQRDDNKLKNRLRALVKETIEKKGRDKLVYALRDRLGELTLEAGPTSYAKFKPYLHLLALGKKASKEALVNSLVALLFEF